ncbi:MAG TPA: CmcJ/NvfI family oxidoreductase [Acetobacteraceae bacterium]|nr:CmcJ/NvfI family oxidoreductase [Acetobacteraceae bacterium]
MSQAVLDIAPAAKDVRAALTFITPQAAKPVFESAAYTGGAPRVLFATERHAVAIHDMRPIAAHVSLDREGFALRRSPTAVADLYDDKAVREAYYPEIEALLRTTMGARRVVIFDATRRSDDGGGAANQDGLRGPASRVHVDYTEKSGPQRVRDFFGAEEAARLFATGTRIVQVNVWRPIRGPVQRSPLALADATSIRPADLIATDQIFPDRIGEIYHLAYHPAQRWYYVPEMERDEVLLIKGWDSLADGRARFTPHGAFALPDTPRAAAPRESIEVRTLVVIER